jgi:hypothetical protein
MISLLYITFTGEVKTTTPVEVVSKVSCSTWYYNNVKTQPKKQRLLSGRTYYVYNGYGTNGETLNIVGYRCSGR